MIRIVKLDHSPMAYPDQFIAALEAQAAQRDQMPLTAENLAALVTGGDAWVASDSQRPLILAGLLPMWEGRLVAWAYLSKFAGPALLRATREIQRQLEARREQRIEMYVQDGHQEGVRWAWLLGFRAEGLMVNFYGGRDYWMFTYRGVDDYGLPSSGFRGYRKQSQRRTGHHGSGGRSVERGYDTRRRLVYSGCCGDIGPGKCAEASGGV